MKRIRSRLTTFVSVALLALLLYPIGRYVTSPSPEIVRAQDRVRAAREVEGRDDRDALPPGDFIGGNGVVEPKDRETRLAAAVPGRIAVLHVAEGAVVEAGAVLVELEQEVEAASLAAAEAEVRAAQAELAELARGNRSEDVESAEADAASARARADLSADRLRRLEIVREAGGVSEEELERARRQATADEEQARSLESRRRAVQIGNRRERVAAARARMVAAGARRDAARADLERRTIRAPIAGTVLQVKYRVGEYYAPGQGEPLVVLGDLGETRVRVDVDERDVGSVAVGSRALVRALAFPGRDFRGRVVELAQRMGRKNVRADDPVERNDTKILEVVVVLENPSGLVVGQRVMAYLERPAAR